MPPKANIDTPKKTIVERKVPFANHDVVANHMIYGIYIYIGIYH